MRKTVAEVPGQSSLRHLTLYHLELLFAAHNRYHAQTTSYFEEQAKQRTQNWDNTLKELKSPTKGGGGKKRSMSDSEAMQLPIMRSNNQYKRSKSEGDNDEELEHEHHHRGESHIQSDYSLRDGSSLSHNPHNPYVLHDGEEHKEELEEEYEEHAPKVKNKRAPKKSTVKIKQEKIDNIPKPKGRPPTGKRWDKKKGKWVYKR